MRRDFRRQSQDNNKKILMYSIVGVVVLLAVVFTLLMYGNSLNKEVKNSQLSPEQIASIVNNETNSASVSSNMGKSVDEAKEESNEIEKDEENTKNNTGNLVSNVNTINNTMNTNLNSDANSSVNKTARETVVTNSSKDKLVKPKKELSFKKPVEGEIMCEYAKENLIFSETLQEWVTHDGIDIKAPKTTVVQAAEEGTVKSIKNDPRYGLTIVIEHDDGFETVYANLLSSEFVSEGEKVTQGQSIGTVGNTGVFESADEPHLHFEILKDNIKVDPNIYLK